MKDKVASQDGDSFWDKIVNFFKSLFGEGEDDDDQATIAAPSDDTGDADDDAATADSGNTDTSDSDTTDSVPSDDTTDDAGEDLTINTEE